MQEIEKRQDVAGDMARAAGEILKANFGKAFHFKTKDGGDKSAIKIIKKKSGYQMHVCDQRGLCIDMCPVGALTRRKNGVVWLDKDICVGCQACVGFCPIEGMKKSDERIEPFKCISCGACVRACSEEALELVEVKIDDVKEIVYYKQGA